MKTSQLLTIMGMQCFSYSFGYYGTADDHPVYFQDNLVLVADRV